MGVEKEGSVAYWVEEEFTGLLEERCLLEEEGCFPQAVEEAPASWEEEGFPSAEILTGWEEAEATSAEIQLARLLVEEEEGCQGPCPWEGEEVEVEHSFLPWMELEGEEEALTAATAFGTAA